MNDHDTNLLPATADFTQDEAMLARFIVGSIRSGGTMFEGRLYECMVARLLDGDLPVRGVSPWDVRLRDDSDPAQCTRLEVRSGRDSFKLTAGQGSDVHVWVLVAKSATNGQPDGFIVATADQIASIGAASQSRQRCESRFGIVTADELSGAVAQAAVEARRSS